MTSTPTQTTQKTQPGAKPTSIKVEPWTDFPRQSYTIHGDDFCHTKPLVAKFTAKGFRSTLNVKETVSKKDGAYSVDDDVKLWFDLPNNHSLYTRVKSSSYIKVHYDHGLCECHGKNWNLYGSFWTDKSLSKASVRAGVASYHEKCHSDNRLRVNVASGAHHFYWYHRTLSFINNWKLGFLSVVDLNNHVLQKNNVLISNTINKNHEVFLRLENEGFRNANPQISDVKTIWDTITLNWVGRFDSTTRAGLETSFSLKDNKIKKVEGVVEKVITQHNVTVKARVNNKYDVAFLVKRAVWGLENIVTLSAGLGINNVISDKRAIHHGIQLDFNI